MYQFKNAVVVPASTTSSGSSFLLRTALCKIVAPQISIKSFLSHLKPVFYSSEFANPEKKTLCIHPICAPHDLMPFYELAPSLLHME